MQNSIDSYKWQWDQPVSLSTTYSCLKTSHTLKADKHEQLQPQVEEVKRMLAALIRKIDAERTMNRD